MPLKKTAPPASPAALPVRVRLRRRADTASQPATEQRSERAMPPPTPLAAPSAPARLPDSATICRQDLRVAWRLCCSVCKPLASAAPAVLLARQQAAGSCKHACGSLAKACRPHPPAAAGRPPSTDRHFQPPCSHVSAATAVCGPVALESAPDQPHYGRGCGSAAFPTRGGGVEGRQSNEDAPTSLLSREGQSSELRNLLRSRL